MSIITRSVAALAVAALAIAPAAIAKPGGGPGGPPAAQHGKGHQKPKKVVAKGTVVSYDATAGTLVVHVTRANHHGKAMVGTDVSFDVSKARIDGSLAAGDKVVVQTVTVAAEDGRYPARHVVDQTHKASGDDAGDAPEQESGQS